MTSHCAVEILKSFYSPVAGQYGFQEIPNMKVYQSELRLVLKWLHISFNSNIVYFPEASYREIFFPTLYSSTYSWDVYYGPFWSLSA